MSSPIPKDWRIKVSAILADGSMERIFVRRRAQHEFEALFPGAFRWDLLDCIRAALSRDEIEGNLVTGMDEPGTVYEFIFQHLQQHVYCKVNLSPDGSVIIIYSAHRPFKGHTL